MRHLILFLCLSSLTDKINGQIILQPTKDGPEVGMVLIPGALLDAENYIDLANEFQEALPYKLWIYIVEGQIPKRDESLIRRGHRVLVEQGMSADAFYIASGHSLGAFLVVEEVKDDQEFVDVCVLMGRLFPADFIDSFTIPVLTIMGDLDGMNRLSSVAPQIEALKSKPDEFKYKFPTKILVGVNHLQFASGEIDPSLLARDLTPEVSDEQARTETIEVTSVFLQYHLTTTQINVADETMNTWYEEASEISMPITEAYRLQEEGEVCPWSIEAQRILADLSESNDPKLMISDRVVSQDELISSRPTIQANVSTVSVESVSSVYVSFEETSPAATMLEVKFKSKEAILSLMPEELSNPYRMQPDVECANVNEVLWSNIFNMSSSVARNRFSKKEITIQFNSDVYEEWGPGWIESILDFEFDGKSLNVTSHALYTEVGENPEFGGMHYCKLLSPAKILEFIYCDGLRK